MGEPLDLIVIDELGFAIESVRDDVEPLAADVDGRSVRQVPAMGQRHPEDRIAGLQRREEHDLVRLGPGMRLNIRCRGIEQFLYPVDGKLLDNVDEFAAAVIPLAGVAFGILVREPGALRLEHSQARVVLRGDELDVRLLPLVLADHGGPKLWVGLG